MKRAPLVLPFLAACLAACEMNFGGKIETCGEYPKEGGPAVISTRDQELCEVVRLRVGKELDALPELSHARLDELAEKSLSWERRDTIDDLVATLRRDAGDAFADAVKRAADAVLARSSRPLPEGLPAEKCLAKGAARGARLAVLYASPSKESPDTAAKDAPKTK